VHLWWHDVYTSISVFFFSQPYTCRGYGLVSYTAAALAAAFHPCVPSRSWMQSFLLCSIIVGYIRGVVSVVEMSDVLFV
jgi:hypothetical protein